MANEDFAVDTELLVLYVTGCASTDYIRMNKRLQGYTRADFDTLWLLLGQARRVIVTSSVLAETSNFVRNISEPAKLHVMTAFRELIGGAEERHVPAPQAAARPAFIRLGFTDAVLLEIAEATLLTADGPLCAEAQRLGRKAMNFNHIREANQ